MVLLVPVMKIALVVPVVILKLLAVQLEEVPKMGVDGMVIQISPLNKARIS